MVSYCYYYEYSYCYYYSPLLLVAALLLVHDFFPQRKSDGKTPL